MTTAAGWDRPSPRIAELIRTGATAFIEDPDVLFATVDAAVLGATPAQLANDPVLAAATSETDRANILHWARANIRDPGARVPPNLGPQVLDLARDVVRRGLEDTTLATYRAGQNIAWRAWMTRAFDLTSDPDELRELLDVTARSIFTFVDETIAGIEVQIERERAQLTRGTHAERLATVNLILEGAPIGSERASERLGYELSGRHLAAVVWSESAGHEEGSLDETANALAHTLGARRPFTVVASARSLWVWITTPADPDLDAVPAELVSSPRVRVALGSAGTGMAGFRTSHLDALATQRLMHRMPVDLRLAAYRDVQLVALATQDDEQASEFVARTLGDLATGDPELRETLRVYIREEFSTSRAARALYAHRNTVLGRLGRAQRLLPLPLTGRGLQVGLALEIVHWLGTGPTDPLPRRRRKSDASSGARPDPDRAPASGGWRDARSSI